MYQKSVSYIVAVAAKIMSVLDPAGIDAVVEGEEYWEVAYAKLKFQTGYGILMAMIKRRMCWWIK